jgi:arylsulfatase A-like enzyme
VPRVHQGRWRKWLGFEVANAPFDVSYFEDDDPTPRRIEGYQTDGLFALAREALAKRRDASRPFICVVSVEPPHFPLRAPAPLEAAWQGRDLQLRPNFLRAPDYEIPLDTGTFPRGSREEVLRKLRLYYAMVENLDANVGAMLEYLERTGLAESTVVVFLSDHGEMGGCQNLRNTVKEYPFEESVGIPLIVRDPRLPGRAGAAVADPVGSEDLYPTLLGLAGLPAEDKPGMDLTPLIAGRLARLPREGILLEFVHDLRPACAFHAQYWRGFRTAAYKYTVLGGAEGGRPWQLFDLQADPFEMRNRVQDPACRDLAARLHGLLRARLVETVDPFVLQPAFGHAGLNLFSDPVAGMA